MANQNALVNDSRLRLKQTEHPHARAVVSSTSTGAICADEVLTRGHGRPIYSSCSLSSTVSDNLELVGVVLVKESDGDAHDAVVVTGDRVGKGDFDRIVVFVPVVRRLPFDLLCLLNFRLSAMVMSGSS